MVTFKFTLRNGFFTGGNRIIRPENIGEGALASSLELLGAIAP